MGIFEKYLSVWIALAMIVGVILNVTLPAEMQLISGFEISNINVVVAVLIWAMVYPMMVGVDLASIRNISRQPKGLVITLVVNWLVKPFSMALLAILFFDLIFSTFITPEDASQYKAGLILLGAAPCTAMVFVWSNLTKGDAAYTLIQVSVNDVIMVFAFAPIVAFLLGVTDVAVPWGTLILATILYVLLPLVAGILTRRYLKSPQKIHQFSQRAKPYSMVGLIMTVVILFGLQGKAIISDPIIILMIAIPILIQSYSIFFIAYAWAARWRVPHQIAAPCALIGTSNFFELAVAVAISLFGLNSAAALATVVGVLVEVPVMLSLVAFANKTRHSFQK